MKLRNFTPHAFTFYALNACIFDAKSKKLIRPVDVAPLFTVAAEPTNLRAALIETPEGGEFMCEGHCIPQVSQTVGSCDPLPVLEEGELALVSFVYMSAAKAQGWDCSRLRTTIPCYLSADGQAAGVVKLSL